MADVVDTGTGEVTSGEVVYYNDPAPVPNLFGSADPAQVLERATSTARVLADVIKQRGLYVTIGEKAHVQVEAWTLLGSMLGVFPVVVWTRRMEDPQGWEARVEAKTLAGAVVGAAEAQCDRSEARWKSRDDYAIRAMAQTRAVSRAMRAPLGFIVQLAGYNPTPAEEMPSGGSQEPSNAPKPATKAQHGKLNAMLAEAQKSGEPPPPVIHNGDAIEYVSWEEWSKATALHLWGVHSRSELTVPQMSKLIELTDSARIPFG